MQHFSNPVAAPTPHHQDWIGGVFGADPSSRVSAERYIRIGYFPAVQPFNVADNKPLAATRLDNAKSFTTAAMKTCQYAVPIVLSLSDNRFRHRCRSDSRPSVSSTRQWQLSRRHARFQIALLKNFQR
jgi:hypothetical protein